MSGEKQNAEKEKILLALDMARADLDYIDKIGKIWRVLNNIASSTEWELEVLVFRRKCPEIKAKFRQ